MCSCKQGSSIKQASAVKQVVKKPAEAYSSSKPTGKKTITRRIVFRRHM